MPTIAIRADYIRHAWRFVAGKTYSSQYLRGVAILPHKSHDKSPLGVLIVGCDGQTAAAFYQDNTAMSRSMVLTLSKETLKALAPARSDSFQRWLVVDYEVSNTPGEGFVKNARVVCADTADMACDIAPPSYLAINGVEEVNQFKLGLYPDMAAAFKRWIADGDCPLGGNVSFDPLLLARFAFASARTQAIRLACGKIPGEANENDPILVMNSEYPEFLGIIAPMRGKCWFPEWAAWLFARKPLAVVGKTEAA